MVYGNTTAKRLSNIIGFKLFAILQHRPVKTHYWTWTASWKPEIDRQTENCSVAILEVPDDLFTLSCVHFLAVLNIFPLLTYSVTVLTFAVFVCRRFWYRSFDFSRFWPHASNYIVHASLSSSQHYTHDDGNNTQSHFAWSLYSRAWWRTCSDYTPIARDDDDVTQWATLQRSPARPGVLLGHLDA